MLNPMQIIGMMSNMKNPQQMVMNIAKQEPQMNIEVIKNIKDEKEEANNVSGLCKQYGLFTNTNEA